MIKVGDTFPIVNLKHAPFNPKDPTACGRPIDFNTGEWFTGRKVVLFAVPGAFTPTCSEYHVPGFLEKYQDLKNQGVDLIVCMATNDAFVMGAWGIHQNVGAKILMVSDGNGELCQKLGLTQDLSSVGMGSVRSQRFALVIDNMTVSYVGVEPGAGLSVSGADAVLSHLKSKQ